MNLVIYVVDDIKEVADITATHLRRAGHHVSVETDSQTALDVLCSDAEIDVIFLDIVMPGMLGSQIYEIMQLRARARCERTVFLTGFREMAPAWIRATGRIVLEKPVSPQVLQRAAAEIGKLGTPRGPRYPTDPPSSPTRLRSHPQLQSIVEDGMKEVSSVTSLAQNGDVMALKIKHIEDAHHLTKNDHALRLTKLEGHFEDKGVVSIIATDVRIGKAWIKSIPVVLTCLSLVLGGLWWFIHQSERENDVKILQQAAEKASQNRSQPQ